MKNKKNIQTYLNQQDRSSEYYEMGMKEFMTQNYKQSINLFDKAISIREDLELAWIYKILSYGELKQNKIAIEQCEKAKNLFKFSYNLCFLYGILLQEEKRYYDAMIIFLIISIIMIKIQKVCIRLVSRLNIQGVSLFELQSYDLARNYFGQILKINLNHGNAYFMQGRIAIQKQEIETAIFCFEQSSQNTPANFYLAQIYMNLSQFQEAKQKNDEFCRNFKDDIKGKLQKGQILRQK